jgi:protein-tyrosine phosphatase
MSGEPYRVLMVCTGNICRSPVMERLLVAKLAARLSPADLDRFEISSAGTWGMVDSPIAPLAAATLVERGGDPSSFAARELDPTLIRAADLVLGATREHRGLVVTSEPSAASRTVTLRELARLLGPVTAADVSARAGTASDDVVDRMRAVVASAFSNRGLVPLDTPADDDIGDPYGRDQAVYVKAADQIDTALDVLVGLLIPG